MGILGGVIVEVSHGFLIVRVKEVDELAPEANVPTIVTVYVFMCKGFEVETENFLRAWSNVI